MKRFVFDTLVERENICNLLQESKLLAIHIQNRANVVIFAPRNYGKTSLVRNIVIDDFRKQNPKTFVFFVDLLGVKDMDAIIKRMINAFERSFAESFPIKQLWENIKTFLAHLKPEVSVDPISGSPSISLGLSTSKKEYSLHTVMQIIYEISKKVPSLIVMDEFQDIAEVGEAEALFRTELQEIQGIPTILMGSKRHILNKMFSLQESPLASWGVDVEIPPIPYTEYTTYMNERFSPFQLSIQEDTSRYLQDLFYRVPEPINIMCQQIIYTKTGKEKITVTDIQQALKDVLVNRESRYESILRSHSKVEEAILIEIAKLGYVEKPQSKCFLEKVRLSNRTVGKVISKLKDYGILEFASNAYRISSPLFNYYLVYYR